MCSGMEKFISGLAITVDGQFLNGLLDSMWQSAGQNRDLIVSYGSSNAYSILNAGGLVLYQGSQSYLKAVDSYFTVKGKSTFMNSLNVQEALKATAKQYQITHI